MAACKVAEAVSLLVELSYRSWRPWQATVDASFEQVNEKKR